MVRRVLLISAFIMLAVPALAGSLNYSNGKGMWQSTQCTRPVPPAFVGLGKDASAETLNAATASFNAFAKQSQEYQSCVSNEARSDGENSNSVISQAAGKQMQDASSEVERARSQLFGKSAPSSSAEPVSQPAAIQPVIVDEQAPQAMPQQQAMQVQPPLLQPQQPPPQLMQPQQLLPPQPSAAMPVPSDPQPLNPQDQ